MKNKLIQSLWSNLTIFVNFDPATTFLGIYSMIIFTQVHKNQYNNTLSPILCNEKNWTLNAYIISHLYQWLSAGMIFVPQGTTHNVWRHFCHNWRKGCYWHLVDRGQGCCWASCNAQDNPTTKNYPVHNVNNSQNEKR